MRPRVGRIDPGADRRRRSGQVNETTTARLRVIRTGRRTGFLWRKPVLSWRLAMEGYEWIILRSTDASEHTWVAAEGKARRILDRELGDRAWLLERQAG
jgi:hypothetical protein